MAKDKKELDDDLLTGGKTLSSDADNKKAEKKKQAAAKKAEKNAAKLAAKKEKLLKEIDEGKKFYHLIEVMTCQGSTSSPKPRNWSATTDCIRDELFVVYSMVMPRCSA